MEQQASACLQYGADDHRWDAYSAICAQCGFDEVQGFSPVPEVYEHFLQRVLNATPQRIQPSTPNRLMAEFQRVFPTPEELADGWNFLREHPEFTIDVLRSAGSHLH